MPILIRKDYDYRHFSFLTIDIIWIRVRRDLLPYHSFKLFFAHHVNLESCFSNIYLFIPHLFIYILYRSLSIHFHFDLFVVFREFRAISSFYHYLLGRICEPEKQNHKKVNQHITRR